MGDTAQMNTVELEIDGQTVNVEPGASIIEAADLVGIYIPRFCYHKNLSIAANCRMCLVEVEKSGKPLPACATPVTPGMKVYTTSKKALEAQRAVMEFLLINHPLDCPICDQGGECELQDISMGYGSPLSYFEEGKRSVYSEDIGSLIETEMTRCIQCTRCVRFGEEVAGLRELGVINRGEHEEISTFVQHFMQSELSGNIIDLCPVGALTAKPSRYGQRSWELKEHACVAPHDCVGSNIYVHTRGEEYAKQRKAHRVVPRENDAVNETWISDRDRFSYEGLHHKSRVLHPRLKKDGKWQEVDWRRALLEIADRTHGVLQNRGPEGIAAVVSPNSTTEECYLLQKLMRGLGSNNIDHRVRQTDFRFQDYMPACPRLNVPLKDVQDLTDILLVGSNVRTEQPIMSHHVNQASLNGANVMAINPVDHQFIFELKHKIIQKNIIDGLRDVVAALSGQGDSTEAGKAIAAKLKNAERGAVFIGAHALNHPDSSNIRALVHKIVELADVRAGGFTEGANAAGAWLAGAIPHRGPAAQKLETPGKDAHALFETPAGAYFLFNSEPEFDCAYPALALSALKESSLVVCFSTFVTPLMEEYADFILPVAPFTESGGSFVNAAGTWQHFAPTSIPHGESRPGWKVLRALANFFELPGFEYQTVHEVRDDLEAKVNAMEFKRAPDPSFDQRSLDGLVRLAPWHMYRADPLVRRADALQKTIDPNYVCIGLNQATAEKLGFHGGDVLMASQGDSHVSLPLVINNRLSDDVVFIPSGFEKTAGFGSAMTAVTLRRDER